MQRSKGAGAGGGLGWGWGSLAESYWSASLHYVFTALYWNTLPRIPPHNPTAQMLPQPSLPTVPSLLLSPHIPYSGPR